MPTNLSAQITPAGISAPTYNQILESLQNAFRDIYGSDVYIAPDSQDGQLLALFALALNDANQMAIKVYQSFSPSFAQGAGLSSVVKINGIRRLSPTKSTAVGLVTGNAGTIITNGVVEDNNGVLWDLPTPLTIPIGGSISVTATAQEAGAIPALAGTINKINNPTRGWQSFVSTSDAVPGAPVESDATLRRRQSVSTSLASKTPMASLIGAVANVLGVTRSRIYENDTNTTDSNGLPAHSISAVVEGGDVQDIVDAIGAKKTPGANTYGTTSGTYTDPYSGIPYSIDFFVLDPQPVEIAIVGTAGAGYTSEIDDLIKEELVTYINALGIGQAVQYLRLFGPAYLSGAAEGQTYEITSLEINFVGDTPGVIDLPVGFNEAATLDASDITITIT